MAEEIDRLERAVKLRVFGGLENSKPHWATDDLWLQALGEKPPAYERIETEFKRIADNAMVINVEDRTWLVTLKEIVDDAD
jgi:hypothetical protein